MEKDFERGLINYLYHGINRFFAKPLLQAGLSCLSSFCHSFLLHIFLSVRLGRQALLQVLVVFWLARPVYVLDYEALAIVLPCLLCTQSK
jgi:hypothetical protein